MSELPIRTHRKQLLAALTAPTQQNLVIVSETGSGKSSQLCQFLIDAAVCTPKRGEKVCITQPRRVAATNLANRVAEERKSHVGELIGYSVRFDCKVSKKTACKFVTDGMLLREAILDPLLSEYSYIFLDEIHERTLHNDVLCAMLKTLQRDQRSDLRIVVMSATLSRREIRKIANFFGNAKVFQIEGRSYPIDVMYCESPQKDYVDAAVVTACQIHVDEPLDGDILVFLTGQEDIESAVHLLRTRAKKFNLQFPQRRIFALPFYASLPNEHQRKIFHKTPQGFRKVIFSTNIAETSLTIPGVKYVVDTGLVKRKEFVPQTGIETLQILPISRAEAWQRAGRAGRNCAGYCYRLYTEQSFDALDENVIPEILRVNLSSVILQMKMLGINDIRNLDFLDSPPMKGIVSALQELLELELLNQEGQINQLGRKVGQLPIVPRYGKVIMKSIEMGCLDQILTIVSMLSVESLFIYESHQGQADDEKYVNSKTASAISKFRSFDGDHCMLVNVYEAVKSVDMDETWCLRNGVRLRSILKACDIRKQLKRCVFMIFPELKQVDPSLYSTDDHDVVLRCLLSGSLMSTAILLADGSYETCTHKHKVRLHPSSCLLGGHRRKPDCVMYNELVVTSREYLRCVSAIDRAWLTGRG